MMDCRSYSIKSLPLEHKNYSTISGNYSWCGDLEHFTKMFYL